MALDITAVLWVAVQGRYTQAVFWIERRAR